MSSPVGYHVRQAGRKSAVGQCALVLSAIGLVAPLARSGDGDSRVILQMFESPWENLEYRMPDIWQADYRGVWVPPPGRADSGDSSVGYDVYDRFDLGRPGKRTLYGTLDGVKQFNATAHRAGLLTYADLILNHCGFSDNNLNGFLNAGDYPGFVISAPFMPYGDFHDPNAGGDWEMRLAGLIDIAQESDLPYLRHPVDANDPRNIPRGHVPLFGRLADVPDPANAQFYPDRQGDSITFTNPFTGQRITKYRFNISDPMAGDPIVENASGLLLRYTQWMNEVVGFDGFRIDAVKHVPNWFFDEFYDNATYLNGRVMLDGSRLNPLSFGEVYDGDLGKLLGYRRHDRVANREVLDFSLFFALRDNLTFNGLANDWRTVVSRQLDRADNGLIDGSAGVRFVQSHDNGGPDLSNVAYACTLLLPGRSIVYFNARQFGDNRPFPADGRGDALGGMYGDTITTLTQIASTHGRGNYLERYLTKELLVYERQANLLVALSNRMDSGQDTVSVQTAFVPGTPLVELTGNADDNLIDPDQRVPSYVVVDGNGRVTLTIPRNVSRLGQHNSGYVVYGPATPTGSLILTNIDRILPPDDYQYGNSFDNGSKRLTPVAVIRHGNFKVKLRTQPVHIPGYGHDPEADGDNAIVRVNDGIDITGRGYASTSPDNDVAYGFQQFVDKRSPLYGGGDGEYIQSINTFRLPEGMNFLTVRAFRRRDANDGSAIYRDFKAPIYIDLLRPKVSIVEPIATAEGKLPVITDDHCVITLASLDHTVEHMHLLVNWDGDPLAAIDAANEAHCIRPGEFTIELSGLPQGALRLTAVGVEPTGNWGAQSVEAIVRLRARGDVNGDAAVNDADLGALAEAMGSDLHSNRYDPSGDFDDDGDIDHADATAMRRLIADFDASLKMMAIRDTWRSAHLPNLHSQRLVQAIAPR